MATDRQADEIGWASSQVFSTDGNFGPSSTLLGRDARDQRGLTGARHGGLRPTGTLDRSAPGHEKDGPREAYIRRHVELHKTQQTPNTDSSVNTYKQHQKMSEYTLHLYI